jgi:hypothetical protein
MNEDTECWWGFHDLMVTAAHRYCLGRRTYIVSECVRWIQMNWDKFHVHTRELIWRETHEALTRDCAGDDCDVSEWNKILELKVNDE